MNTKCFLKWAVMLLLVVFGTIYLASAILISERIAGAFDFRASQKRSFRIVETPRDSKKTAATTASQNPKGESPDNGAKGDNVEDKSPKRTEAATASQNSKGDSLDNGAKDDNLEDSSPKRAAAKDKNGESPDNGAKGDNVEDKSPKRVEAKDKTGVVFTVVPEEPQNTGRWILRLVPNAVGSVVFVFLVALPFGLLHYFLVRPLRNIPIVSPELIRNLDADDTQTREDSGVAIALAMLASGSVKDAERESLTHSIERPSNIAEDVRGALAAREVAAKAKAVQIATMAGLTMAASSSAVGDGLGMFFWKSKLVYETFRIYGFRPDARTTVSIWAHVVFASLLAASVEELCELFDVSELVGGFGTRAIQGTVGAAVVLKGGQLTRAYLTRGISSESRRRALAEFRNSAKDDLASVASSVGESLTKIGFKAFSA